MGCRRDLYTICVSINNVQYEHGMYSRYRGRAAVYSARGLAVH